MTLNSINSNDNYDSHNTEHQINDIHSIDILSKIISIFFSVISFIYIVCLFYYFDYGFDFTDEGCYLLLMQRPFEYNSFAILSGFIYHPLYLVTQGNIFLLRAINFFVILLIAYNFCREFLINFTSQFTYFTGLYLNLSAFQLSICATNILLIWLPTPNYNLLNYLGLIITGTGVLYLSSKTTNITKARFVLGWLIIGLGAYLSFMSRPQTAVFLGILVIVWSSVAKKITIKGFFLTFFTTISLIIITSFITDGSIFGLLDRFIRNAQLESISGSHNVFKIITFSFSFLSTYWSFNFTVIILLLFIFGLSLAVYQHKLIFYLSLVICNSILFLLFILNYLKLFWYNFMSGYIVWVPIAGYIIGIILKHKGQISKPDYPLALFFLLLTILYGLGSNNSIFFLTSVSAFFTLIALLVILLGLCKKMIIPRILISVIAISSIATICVVTTSLGNPYRQPPILWKYPTKGYIRSGDAPIKLHNEIATLLKNIHYLAKKEGLQPNTPIIDFSAVKPGIIYALDGYTPRIPWIYSTQSNASEEFLFVVLNKFTCEQIAESWLLFTTGGGILRKHDPQILRKFGANFPNDYTEAGRVPLNYNIKSDNEEIPYLLVFKPIRTHEEATAACIARKSELKIM